MTDVGSDLTAEQRAIVELDAKAQTIVVAGPGTGKTHALVQRAHALLARDVAASEVLVLSFTNAVVGELRRRLAQLEDSDVAYVRPVTIDAFAARVVGVAGVEPAELGFDEIVRRAAIAIREGLDADLVDRYRHVIVDEAQDLVGVRLEFIMAILEATQGGFTLLGDPAQGIYGFTGSAGDQATGVEALAERFPTATVMSLTHDHRSLRADAGPGHRLRDMVLNDDGESARVALARGLRDSDRITPEQLATVLRRADATTGVLCRTNGEALVISGLMAESGVKHSVRRAAADVAPPSWVARDLREVASAELSRSRFAELTERDEYWVDDAWKALRRLAGNRSGGVDMHLLRERLARLTVEEAPDDLESVPVLSTVHRSKGLEYDTVVVLDPDGANADRAEAAEEARIVYVALTRARRRTVRLTRPELSGRLTRRRGRWAMVPWRGAGTLRIELRVGDASGTLGDEDANEVQARQRYLREGVNVGDPVTLRLLASGRSYAIEHNGHQIATTGEGFAPFADSWPGRIDGVRIDCLRSAAGDPGRTKNLGIGAGGFWLVPEIVGLGSLTWKDALT